MSDKLKGELSIARLIGGDEKNSIRIEIIDELSRTLFLDLRINAEAFALALTGGSNQPCEFKLRSDKVGLQHEFKEEVVALDCTSYDRKALEKAAVKALKPLEVNGWTGTAEDCLNHHRRVGEGRYRVRFTRHVLPPC